MATTAVATPAPGRVRNLSSALTLWHLLSLDAPCVAALWTVFTARCFEVRLPWTVPAALSLAVWMLYAADRLADASHGAGAMQERHWFHREHRFAFVCCLFAAVPLMVALLFAMPADVRNAWMLMSLPMAIYAGAVHLLRLPRLPKEHLVGVFFAVAVSLPVLVARGFGPHGIANAAVAFGAVCWMNCVAIARWEQETQTDGMTLWAAKRFPLAACVLCVLCMLLPVVRGGHVLFGFACVLALVALVLMDRARRGISPLVLRSLADAALLTPLLLWPLLPR